MLHPSPKPYFLNLYFPNRTSFIGNLKKHVKKQHVGLYLQTSAQPCICHIQSGHIHLAQKPLHAQTPPYSHHQHEDDQQWCWIVEHPQPYSHEHAVGQQFNIIWSWWWAIGSIALCMLLVCGIFDAIISSDSMLSYSTHVWRQKQHFFAFSFSFVFWHSVTAVTLDR